MAAGDVIRMDEKSESKRITTKETRKWEMHIEKLRRRMLSQR